MATAHDTEVDHRHYLLTLDLPYMVRAYEQVGLKTNPTLINDLGLRLTDRVRQIFPHLEVIVLDLGEIKQGIHRLLEKSKRLHPGAVVITTNRFLCPKTSCDAWERACCLEINRIVDENGESIGLGPRPWHEPTTTQVRRIANFSVQRSTIILEDGSWSGKTVAQLIAECQEAGIEVADVICGIMFEKGYAHIRESGYHRDISWVNFQEQCLDWMPDHDFYPFMPSCGRVVGQHHHEHGFMPTQVNGFSLAYPYILPYGKPKEWASIPEESMVEFSIGCLADTIALFEDLEAINGQTITVDRIIRLYPRTSFPHRRDRPHRLNDSQRRIIDILHEDHNEMKEVVPQ